MCRSQNDRMAANAQSRANSSHGPRLPVHCSHTWTTVNGQQKTLQTERSLSSLQWISSVVQYVYVVRGKFCRSHSSKFRHNPSLSVITYSDLINQQPISLDNQTRLQDRVAQTALCVNTLHNVLEVVQQVSMASKYHFFRKLSPQGRLMPIH